MCSWGDSLQLPLDSTRFTFPWLPRATLTLTTLLVERLACWYQIFRTFISNIVFQFFVDLVGSE